MNSWLRIVRPINGLMGVFATWISAFIGVGLNVQKFLIPVGYASLIVFLVTSGGNVINDIVDVEVDKVNHPERPIVKGIITKKQAKIAAVLFFVAPLVLSILFISLIAFVVVVLAELLLISYETKTKRAGLIGNITISVLVGLIFIFGGFAVNSIFKMLLLFGMASLANFSRELIKDIEDIEGDVDRNTFPKRHGVKNAMILASSSVIIAIIISAFPYYLGIFSFYYLIVVVFSDILFIMSILVMRTSPKRSQNISKYAMIIGLISFAVGGIS